MVFRLFAAMKLWKDVICFFNGNSFQNIIEFYQTVGTNG